MAFRLVGSARLFKVLQPLKASSPMASIPAGRDSSSSFSQPLNERAPMDASAFGKRMVARFVQPLKASSAIEVMPVK